MQLGKTCYFLLRQTLKQVIAATVVSRQLCVRGLGLHENGTVEVEVILIRNNLLQVLQIYLNFVGT